MALVMRPHTVHVSGHQQRPNGKLAMTTGMYCVQKVLNGIMGPAIVPSNVGAWCKTYHGMQLYSALHGMLYDLLLASSIVCYMMDCTVCHTALGTTHGVLSRMRHGVLRNILQVDGVLHSMGRAAWACCLFQDFGVCAMLGHQLTGRRAWQRECEVTNQNP